MLPRFRFGGAVLIALALGAALAPGAFGATRIETTSDRPLQRWADRALVPTPDAVIEVIEEPCPFDAAPACTYEGSSTIWISPEAGRAVFLHELGHHFDYLELDDAERNLFRRLVGESRDWRSPPNSPHENFAEAYRLCASKRRLKRPPRLWLAGFRPVVRRYRRVCRRIRRSYSTSPVIAGDGGASVVTAAAAATPVDSSP